jgi:hypothetical protein
MSVVERNIQVLMYPNTVFVVARSGRGEGLSVDKQTRKR